MNNILGDAFCEDEIYQNDSGFSKDGATYFENEPNAINERDGHGENEYPPTKALFTRRASMLLLQKRNTRAKISPKRKKIFPEILQIRKKALRDTPLVESRRKMRQRMPRRMG